MGKLLSRTSGINHILVPAVWLEATPARRKWVFLKLFVFKWYAKGNREQQPFLFLSIIVVTACL